MLTALWLAVVFLLPGGVLAAAARPVMGGWRVAAAPATSVLLLGWVGWLGGRIGWRPSAAALVAAAGVLGAAAGLGLRALWRASRHRVGPAGTGNRVPPRRDAVVRAVVGVVGLAGAVVAGLWVWRAGGPWWSWTQAIPRYWDAPWHGYLIGLVQHTGITDVTQLVPRDPLIPTWTDYYPAGWHVAIGTAMALADGDAAIGLMQAQFFFVVLVLPAGVLALLRELQVRSRVVLLLAPVLTVLVYPVIWLVDTPAYAAALALLPVALALVLRMVRRGWRPAEVLAGGAVSAAVFLVQPAVVAVIIIVAVCYLGARLLRGRSLRAVRPGLPGRAGLTLRGAGAWGGATLLLALPWLWHAVTHAAATFTYARALDASYPQALVELFVQYRNSGLTPTIGIALALAAAVLLVLRRHRWLTVVIALFAVLYLVARAEHSDLRQLLTGFWYTDWYRLGAVVWLLAIVICCVATDVLLRRHPVRVGRPVPIMAAVAIALALGWGLPVWLSAAQDRVANRRMPLVRSEQLRASFTELASLVAPGDRVLNDWPDGSPWMYALRGVDPLMMWTTSDADPDRVYLVAHFSQLGRDPRVAQLLARYRIHYVFQGPPGGIAVASRLRMPPGAVGLTPVYQDGWIRIHRIPDVVGAETS